MSSTGLDPRSFFDQYVLPSFHQWQERPLDLRLAKNAIAEANNMSERMFLWLREHDDSFNISSPAEYRDYIVREECEHFAFVRDIADAHKHIRLHRKTRRISEDSQTKQETTGGLFLRGHWLPGLFIKGYWGEKEKLAVTLDDGQKVRLAVILPKVVEMWENLLNQAGLHSGKECVSAKESV